MTKRMAILFFLAKNGRATKEEIIKAVWGKCRKDFDKESYWNSNVKVNTMRGWASTTFREMVKDGRLVYDKHTRTWYVGQEGWVATTAQLMDNLFERYEKMA